MKEDDNMILETKTIKSNIINDLKNKVEKIQEKPSLTVVQVGDNLASNVYIRNKAQMCKDIGYQYQLKKYPENITESELIKEINKLNNDNTINAVLVQMPLPKHLNELTIQNSITPLKDVDGLTDINIGKLIHNKEGLFPCTAIGIIDLLDYYNIEIESKNVVIIGRSNLVGRPVAELFINRNATVTLCHSYTNNLSEITKKADIIVVAVGRNNILTNDMVNSNTIIIDVGINNVNGKLSGDADFENLKDIVKGITPVPGGVGQITVAELGKNILKAYYLQQK